MATLDYPIYLFNEGTNCNAYKLFKPTYVVKDKKKCWRFRVWAPHAKAISVVGSFNDWDKSDSVMTRISDSGIWEIFIRGIKKYDLYKYAILSQSGEWKLKADPFALHAETAPGTASKIYDLNGFDWSDSQYLEERKKSNPYTSPMNIYEVHFGSWKKHADGNVYSYRNLADELVPYVKEMGYTHVEILPLTEHPFDGSWGYQTTGLYAPTSRYGTPHDFMYFVDKCHENGIGVIMDFVLSHFPKDGYGLYEFDGTCQYEYDYCFKQEHKGWGTRVYDYNKPQVRSFLISAVCFWLENYHIDGMRLDAVASMLYLNYDRQDGEWEQNEYGNNYNIEAINFIKQLNKSVLSKFKNVLMIAEESTSYPMVTMPPSSGGLGFNFKWNMGWMNDVLDYEKTDPFFRKGSHDKLTFSITYAFSENFILPFSHDEVVHGKSSMIGKMTGAYEERFDALRTLYAYQISHPGKKLNFMGNEFAQFIEWNYEKPLDWLLLDYDYHRAMQIYVRDLNRFYLKTKELYCLDSSYDGFKWLVVDDSKQNIIAYERFDEKGNGMAVILNFSSVKRENYEIGINEGTYEIAFDSSAKKYGGRRDALPKFSIVEKPNHGKKQSLVITLEGNSAIFIKHTPKSLQITNKGDKKC